MNADNNRLVGSSIITDTSLVIVQSSPESARCVNDSISLTVDEQPLLVTVAFYTIISMKLAKLMFDNFSWLELTSLPH